MSCGAIDDDVYDVGVMNSVGSVWLTGGMGGDGGWTGEKERKSYRKMTRTIYV